MLVDDLNGDNMVAKLNSIVRLKEIAQVLSVREHISGSMAYAICELAQHIPREETVKYILPGVFAVMEDVN